MHKIVSLDAECASYHMMILIAPLSGMLASYFNEKIKDCQVILHSVWSIFGNHIYVILKKKYAVHCKRYQFSFVCLMSDFFYMMCLWLQDIILTHWGRDKMAAFSQTYFKRIFANENIRISTKNSLKFVPKGLINNTPALVLIIAWRWPGNKPLSEPMLVRSLTHICVTRPQWFNSSGAETGIFWKNWVRTIAANVTATCVARFSTVMIMTMQDKWALVLVEEEYCQSVLRNDKCANMS